MKPNALSKFSAKAAQPAAAPTPATTERDGTRAARGTAKRTAVAVRVTQDDWIAMHEFALTQRKSLNQLLIEGFQELQRQAGVKPISGNVK
jgi:hypothetical protein